MATTVRNTSPNASMSTGRSTLMKSRFGMSQPSANRSGGMNKAKNIAGSMWRSERNGRNDRTMPAPTSSNGAGTGTQRASAPVAATASKRKRVISSVAIKVDATPKAEAEYTPVRFRIETRRNRAETLSLKPRSGLSQERFLLLRGRAPQDCVAMRVAAEAED